MSSPAVLATDGAADNATDDATNGGHLDRGFAPIEDAIAAIGRGEIVIVVDDEDRENEGDLIMAAEKVTTAHVAFFLHHTSGFLCTAITGERARGLRLDPMVSDNTESMRTAFLVSVDLTTGTSTGISASDRAATVRALADPATHPSDLARPGHVLPLEARDGGVLKRTGHTEATVDLARLAGLEPAGLLCEIVTSDKAEMARVDELRAFATEHDLLMITIADLVRYRRRTEKIVRRVATAPLATRWGGFTCHTFRSDLDGVEHLALTLGELGGDEPVLVRVHGECLAGDVFGSSRCHCAAHLDEALERVRAAGRGAVVYLRGNEGHGVGTAHSVRGSATGAVPHSGSREYGVGAQILVDLGVGTMLLMTNNVDDYGGLAGFGLEIADRLPLRAGTEG